MCAFDKVNADFQIQQYDQGGIDSTPSSGTGSMPDGTMVRSPSSENLLAGKGIESEAQATMRDSGEQVSGRTESAEPTSFKTSQTPKNPGVNRTNKNGILILGGLSSYRSTSSVGADTAELGAKESAKAPRTTPSKLVSSSSQFQTYKNARAELKPMQQRLQAFITIASGAVENPKKQSADDLRQVGKKIDDAYTEITDWQGLNSSKSSFIALQNFAKEMGRTVKDGEITREQGVDAIKLFLKVTQSSNKEDIILESKGQRAKAQLKVASLKHHPKSSKAANLPKNERRELIEDLEKAANRTDGEIYESAADEKYQNKPETFIEIMDKEIRK